MDFFKLKKWAFEDRLMFKHIFKPQDKYPNQKNVSVGYCVPIQILEEVEVITRKEMVKHDKLSNTA